MYILILLFYKYNVYFYYYFLQALQEISIEERKHTLDNKKLELGVVKEKLESLNNDINNYDKKLQELLKKVLN